MGISIKHDAYERAIRELASARGVSLTEAVGMAVRNELERDAAAQRRDAVLEGIRKAQAIYAASPILDDRTPDEIIGYDEHGLPA